MMGTRTKCIRPSISVGKTKEEQSVRKSWRRRGGLHRLTVFILLLAMLGTMHPIAQAGQNLSHTDSDGGLISLLESMQNSLESPSRVTQSVYAAVAETPAPVLDPLPHITNQQELIISGSSVAAVGSTVNIYRDFGSNGHRVIAIADVDDNGRFRQVVTLPSDGVHRFKATASLVGQRESAFSQIVETELDTAPPGYPRNGSWISSNPNHISLKWEAPLLESSIAKYEIRRDDLLIAETADTFFEDREVHASALHVYKIIAYDAAGNGSDNNALVMKAGTANKELTRLTVAEGARIDRTAISADGRVVALIETGDGGSERLYVRNLANDQPELVMEVQGGYFDYPEFSDDGKSLIYSASLDGNAPARLYVYEREKKSSLEIPGTVSGVLKGELSVDGSEVFYLRRSGQNAPDIITYNVAQERLSRIDQPPIWGTNVLLHDFAGEGRYLAYSYASTPDESPSIYIYDMQGKVLEKIADTGDEPRLSADGRYVLYNQSNRAIVKYDRVSKASVVLVEGSGEEAYRHLQISADGNHVLYSSVDKFDPYLTQNLVLIHTNSGDRVEIGNRATSKGKGGLSQDGTRVIFSDADTRARTDPSGFATTAYLYCMQSPVLCGGGQQPAEEIITSMNWKASSMTGQQAELGSSLQISMQGLSGSTVEANITYQHVEPDRETPLERIATIPLAEVSSGSYLGALPLQEGVAEVTSIRIKASREGRSAEKFADHLPLEVSGRFMVRIEAYNPALLEGASLVIWNPILRTGGSVKLTSSPEAMSLTVPSSDQYRLTLIGPNGQKWAETGDQPRKVRNGLITSVSMQAVIPALLQVSISNDLGDGIRGAAVKVRDARSSMLLMATWTDIVGKVALPVGSVGQQVVIETEIPGDYEYPAPRELTLAQVTPADYVLPIARGVVSGVVKDDQGNAMEGVTVMVTQPGSRVTAISGADGRYELSVPIGASTLEASQLKSPFLVIERPVSLTVPREGVYQNITVSPIGQANVSLSLLTKEIGADWSSVTLTRINTGFYPISVTTYSSDWPAGKPVVHSVSGNELFFQALSGQRVRICVSPLSSDFKPECVETKLDEYRKAAVEVRLQQSSAVKGTLAFNNSVRTQKGALYPLDDQEKRKGNAIPFSIMSSSFHVNVPEAGRYSMVITSELRNRQPSIHERIIQLSEGQIVDLGEIGVPNPGIFSGMEGNSLNALTQGVLEGGQLSLRGSFHNQSGMEVRQAELLIRIPSGTELLEQSVLLSGKLVNPVKQSASVYTVAIGDMPADMEGAISYRLQVGQDAGKLLQPSLDIGYGTEGSRRVEPIGTIGVEVIRSTLDVPSVISSLNVTLSGRAPADSQVLIYEESELVGEVKATPGGYWVQQVTLRDKPFQRMYALRAISIKGGEQQNSEEVFVKYDASAPYPTEVVLNNRTTVDLTQGVVRIPYTVNPSNGITFLAKFAHPERVENVKLYVGENEVAMRPYGSDYFQGWIEPPLSGLGDISIDYGTKQGTYLDPGEPRPEQLMESLPRGIQDIKVIIDERTSGKDGDITIVKADYRKPEIVPSGNIELRVEQNIAFVPYELPKGSPPIYNLITSVMQSGHTRTYHLEAIVPSSSVSTFLKTKKLSGAFSKISFELKDNLMAATDLVDVIQTAIDYKAEMKELEKFLNEVANVECMPSNVRKYYQREVEELADQWSTNLVLNYMLQLTSIGISAVGGPVGGAAMLYFGPQVKELIQQQYDDMKKKLRAEFEADKKNAAQSDECKKEEKPDEEDSKKPKKPDRKPDLRPYWIYDPSGYVYEAVPSNRISGVKSTLFEKNKETAEWMPWNGDWFGQQNPLVTNEEGRYAWDVPEGTWQVRYEKEGYEPAQSAELHVLPPQLDVNIPLVSRKSPEVQSVYSVEQGAQLQLDFSKYMLPETLSADKFTVTQIVYGKEKVVAVSVEPIQGERDLQNRDLVRSIRLIPVGAERWTEGDIVHVHLAPSVFSYAEVPLAEAYDGTVTITANLPVPEEGASQAESISGENAIMVQWKNATENRLATQFRVYWKAIGDSTENTSDHLPGYTRMYGITGLKADTTYEIRIATVDTHGSESPGVNLEGHTLKREEVYIDTLPPAEVSSPFAKGGSRSLSISWVDPADPDFDHVNVYVKPAGQSAFPEGVPIANGTGVFLKSGIAPGRYEIKLTTEDSRGNESVGVTMPVVVAEIEGGGSSGGGPVYGVPTQAGSSAEDMNVKEWTVAAGNSTLSAFGGALLLDGVSEALSEGTKLCVIRHVKDSFQLPTGFTSFSSFYTVSDDNSEKFRKPMELSLSFTVPHDSPIDARRLGLFRGDRTIPSGWRYVGGLVDEGQGRILASIDQSGTYSVLLYSKDFKDITKHWAHEDIEVLVSRHIIEGVDEVHFEPERPVTRAEFVKLAVTALNMQPHSGAEHVLTYTDVEASAWYTPYVNLATAHGIVEGAQGLFRPNDPVTREEAAVILSRISGEMNVAAEDALIRFEDAADISAWARPAMNHLVVAGLLQGDERMKLAPKRSATRAESAVIFLRWLTKMKRIAK